MAAYRRVYDSRHLQADCQEPGSAPDRTLGNRVWATFTFFYLPALAGTTPGARRRGRPRTAWVAAVSVVYRRPTGAVVTVQRVRRRLQMSRLQTRLDNIKTWTELPRGRVSQNDRGQR